MSPNVENVEIEDIEKAEELSGSLKMDLDDDKLMHSVLENDQQEIDKGNVINEALNQSIGSFSPDLMFEQLVSNYKMAEQIFGPKIIKHIGGYDPQYVDRNIKIPEFQRELKSNIIKNIETLRKDGLLDDDNNITETGLDYASVILAYQELDTLVPKSLQGEHFHKKTNVYGDKGDVRTFKKGDRFSDLSIRKTIKQAIKRNRDYVVFEDFKSFEKNDKGTIHIVYAVDSSGSMRGKKIEMAKKAGVALSFKAINNKDKVGLISFNTSVEDAIEPTSDFSSILKSLVRIKTGKETNFVSTIEKSIELFGKGNLTKHLLLLTDALPTFGDDPETDTVSAVAVARENGITVSIVGINLDDRGEKLAKKMVEVGEGKLYLVKDIENLDKVVLQDYYSL